MVEMSRRRALAPPIADLVAAIAAKNTALGHVNLGAVSIRTGFIDVHPPATALPASHGAWDAVAADLPRLTASLAHRSAVEALPPLSAAPAALPDTALTRAATVLGLLAHAWTHLGPPTPTPLPRVLREPWAEVCARLGRPATMLTYDDLIANNWRADEPAIDGVRTVERCRLLVPTVGNEEEHRFYLTQLEILSRAGAIIRAVSDADAGLRHDDAGAVAVGLAQITRVLREITRASLPKIDPRPDAAFHVDPLVWAKTVAPLAVPIAAGPPGPSGTSSPLFHLLDVVLGRRDYRSALGREALAIRSTHPDHWRQVVTAAEGLDLPAAVAVMRDATVTDALREAREAYAGPDGLLGRHRLKVMGYIELGFRVGRSVTIGGFAGALHQRPWHAVGDALTSSIGEREREPDGPCPPRPSPARRRPRATPRAVPLSVLLGHSARSPTRWIAIDGAVYDVTGFGGRHPGGPAILLALAGLDASAAFARVGHAGHAGVLRTLAGLRVGTLEVVAAPRRAEHARLGELAMLAVEYDNTLLYERRILTAKTGAEAPADAPSPLQRALALEACDRHTGDIRRHLLPRVHASCDVPREEVPAPDAPSPSLDAALAFTLRLAVFLRRALAGIEGDRAARAPGQRAAIRQKPGASTRDC